MARHVCRELDSGDGERGYGDRDYEERGEEEREWRRESDEMAGGGDVIDGRLGDVGAGLGEGGP